MEDGWREMDLVPFTMGSCEESRANGGKEVGGNVLAEGEKLKKEACRERKLNPLLHRFGLGRA